MKISEVIELISGGTPNTKKQEYWNGNIPWLSVADFNNNNKFVYTSSKFITKEGYSNCNTNMLNKGDIIISARGTVGVSAILGRPMAFNQSCYGIRGIEKVSDTDYIYYYLKYIVNEIIQNSYGAVFDTITTKTFDNIDINLPSLDTQKKITFILNSFDDKIDVLYRQNATLEKMAETLFRQWFIVEAKDDWEDVKLGDFFSIKTGKKDANYAVENGSYPFFTCSQKIFSAPDFSFEGSAILLAGNGDFNIKRYTGKFEAYQRTYVLIPYDTEFYNFLYILMKYYLLDITDGHRGSVVNFITKGMIENFKFYIPKADYNNKLKIFNDLYKKVDDNTYQISTLERLRDTLLPKLMSGEIRVQCDEEAL